MKRIYILLLILISTTSSSIFAQQKIDPTVEVKRDFESTLIEINKSKLNTTINDTLNNLNLDFNYTIFEKPYKDMYEFNPLPSLKLQNNSAANNPYFFARVSAGYPLAPVADLYFQPFTNSKRLSNKHRFVVSAHYNAFLGKLPLQEYSISSNELKKSNSRSAANNSKIGATANYTNIWDRGELESGVEFYHKSTLFYGVNSINNNFLDNSVSYLKDNASRNYNTFLAFLKIRSYESKKNHNRFKYNFNFNYRNTSDNINLNGNKNISMGEKFGENLLSSNGYFGPTIGKYNQFLIGYNAEASFGYNSNYNNIGFLEVTPQYKYENGNITLNVGANIAIPFNNDKGEKTYHSIITPQVNLSIEVAKRRLWFYALLEGENRLNNYSSILELNSWYLPIGSPEISSTPYSIEAGLKGKIAESISYNIYAGYARRMGMLQFITPIEGAYFSAAYSTHNDLFVGANLDIKSERFNGGLKFKYHSYSKGVNAISLPDNLLPIGYSPLEALIFAKYTIRERITIGAEMDYRAQTPTQIGTPINIENNTNISQPNINSFINLSINGSYVINNNLGLFINIGNILNSKIQYLPFYLEQGVNFNAGATIKF